MTGQKLRGFVGQSMSGRRKPATPVTALLPILATTVWTVPANGIYRFIVWGGGANGVGSTRAGGAGQLYIAERPLSRGQQVTIVSGAVASSSTVTLPSGEVITALGATNATGGASSTKNRPGDIVVNGGNGTSTGTDTGPPGPSYLDYTGGIGGASGGGQDARMPAGGGGSGSTNAAAGLVLAHQVLLRP